MKKIIALLFLGVLSMHAEELVEWGEQEPPSEYILKNFLAYESFYKSTDTFVASCKKLNESFLKELNQRGLHAVTFCTSVGKECEEKKKTIRGVLVYEDDQDDVVKVEPSKKGSLVTVIPLSLYKYYLLCENYYHNIAGYRDWLYRSKYDVPGVKETYDDTLLKSTLQSMSNSPYIDQFDVEKELSITIELLNKSALPSKGPSYNVDEYVQKYSYDKLFSFSESFKKDVVDILDFTESSQISLQGNVFAKKACQVIVDAIKRDPKTSLKLIQGSMNLNDDLSALYRVSMRFFVSLLTRVSVYKYPFLEGYVYFSLPEVRVHDPLTAMNEKNLIPPFDVHQEVQKTNDAAKAFAQRWYDNLTFFEWVQYVLESAWWYIWYYLHTILDFISGFFYILWEHSFGILVRKIVSIFS